MSKAYKSYILYRSQSIVVIFFTTFWRTFPESLKCLVCYAMLSWPDSFPQAQQTDPHYDENYGRNII